MLSLFKKSGAAAPVGEERSATDESWAALSSGPSGILSVAAAEELAAVTACIDLIAGSLASVPAYLYSARPDGIRTEIPAPVWLVRPNVWQTWPQMISYVVRQCLLHGQAFIQVVEQDDGAIWELRPWPSTWVQMTVANGKASYTVSDAEGMYGPAGKTWRLLGDEMVVLTDSQDIPCRGVSRLRRAAAVFSHARAAEDAAGASLTNGARPSGVLTATGKLDAQSRSNLASQLRQSFSGKAAGGVLILDNGKQFQALNLASAADQQLLESRRYSTEQICSVFGVPPVMIGVLDNANYSNSLALEQSFCTHTLLPWARKIESAFNCHVLSASQRLEIDLSGLMRADYATRWEANERAINSGCLSVNEIREQEGFNPVPDGDKPRTFNQAGTGNG